MSHLSKMAPWLLVDLLLCSKDHGNSKKCKKHRDALLPSIKEAFSGN
jgi:hypothetical protein